MKKIIEKALEILEKSIEDSGKIENLDNGGDIFRIINSLIIHKKLELAEKVLQYYIKFQEKKGIFNFKNININKKERLSPVYFLEVLIKLNEKYGEENYFFKKYIKNIKLSIEYIENNFDEVYLLVYFLSEREHKIFFAVENSIYLSIADSLFEKLNEIEENSYADRAFMLKGKVELGFSRYFWNHSQKKLIGRFMPEIVTFELPRETEILEIFKRYIPENKFYEEEIERLIKNISTEAILHKRLLILKEMKKKKHKNYNKEIENIRDYIIYFPEKIFKNDENNKDNRNIIKSLFPEFKDDSKEFLNRKIIITNLYNLKTLNLFLEIFEENG